MHIERLACGWNSEENIQKEILNTAGFNIQQGILKWYLYGNCCWRYTDQE